jgi:hypothetical protein
VLQFDCEYCELAVFDNIKEPVVNGNTPYTQSIDYRDGKDKDHLPK